MPHWMWVGVEGDTILVRQLFEEVTEKLEGLINALKI